MKSKLHFEQVFCKFDKDECKAKVLEITTICIEKEKALPRKGKQLNNIALGNINPNTVPPLCGMSRIESMVANVEPELQFHAESHCRVSFRIPVIVQ